MGGGMPSGGQNGKGSNMNGIPPGGLNGSGKDPPPCHNGSGSSGMNGGHGSGSSGGSGSVYRLATDPLPPVHSLGLGGHFGSSSGNGNGVGGAFLSRYDPRHTEALLDVCIGGPGGGHLGNDPLLLPLPSPESLLELAELYRDDPPAHDVEPPQPDPPPLLAPLTPMDPQNPEHCISSNRGSDGHRNFSNNNNSHFIPRTSNASSVDNGLHGRNNGKSCSFCTNHNFACFVYLIRHSIFI